MLRKVLLLNASYEALGTIGVPRAVPLTWKGSAEMVEPDDDRILRSQDFSVCRAKRRSVDALHRRARAAAALVEQA